MKKSIIFSVLLILTLVGCDIDPFGMSTKTISGPYKLKQWEDFETYYLVGPDSTGWGAIEGTVNRIGWNKDLIIVLQNDDGNGSGWRVIDVKSQSISKLMTKDKIIRFLNAEGIVTYSAAIAWGML